MISDIYTQDSGPAQRLRLLGWCCTFYIGTVPQQDTTVSLEQSRPLEGAATRAARAAGTAGTVEDQTLTRGLGAAKLILPMGAEKQGVLGRKVAMFASPLRMSADIPKGKAALRRQPSLQTEAEVKKLKTVVRAEATARRKAEEKAKAEATVRRQLEAKLEAEATARRRALPVIRTHTYGHRRCGAAGSREGMANRVCTRKGMSAIYQW